MNDKETREIRRRFTPDKTWINAVHGCYINESGKVISTFCESVQTMAPDKSERVLGLIKKVLSGTAQRNRLSLEFSARQVMESEEHRLLMALNKSALEDEELLRTFYERIASTLNIESDYIVLLAHDVYSVPYRGRDGSVQSEFNEDEFSYFVCGICPVKQTQPQLSYRVSENCFDALSLGAVISAPQLGFMFPAFDDRATNIYALLYYTKSTTDNHGEFTRSVFGLEPPMNAAAQKETFGEILSASLEEECSIEVVQAVNEHIGQIMAMHKESRSSEPLTVSKAELNAVLDFSGVSAPHIAAFDSAYDAHFGTDTLLPPVNVVEKRHFTVSTDDVTIKVDPDHSDMVELRSIDGCKYILIPADDVVEVNGIRVQFGDK